MSALINAVNGKVTVPDILNRKSGAPSPSPASNPSTKSAFRIVCLTAYDYPTARLVDDAGVDIVLVGDSLGMVVLGYEDTLSVTLEDMLHHTRAVHRGVRKALLVTDMPYGSYHVDKSETLRNALRLVKEGGSEAVKIEGGERRMDVISRLVEAEIPVMGHVGLTPQSVHAFGGFRVQGKSAEAAEQIWRDARAVEAAGAFAVVLESIPRELASEITRELHIPTIGIGAGPDCDGQILVLHDMIGLGSQHTPKFARRFAHVGESISSAVAEYAADVRNGSFPSDEESFHSPGLTRDPSLALRNT